MARTLSIFIAGAVLLVTAVCMAMSGNQGLFFDSVAPDQSAIADQPPTA